MTDVNLYLRIQMLPKPLKNEILNYLNYITSKKPVNKDVILKHPKAGCMKNTFIMADDFEIPLDDFKE
jgi:hypothetical protein